MPKKKDVQQTKRAYKTGNFSRLSQELLGLIPDSTCSVGFSFSGDLFHGMRGLGFSVFQRIFSIYYPIHIYSADHMSEKSLQAPILS